MSPRSILVVVLVLILAAVAAVASGAFSSGAAPTPGAGGANAAGEGAPVGPAVKGASAARGAADDQGVDPGAALAREQVPGEQPDGADSGPKLKLRGRFVTEEGVAVADQEVALRQRTRADSELFDLIERREPEGEASRATTRADGSFEFDIVRGRGGRVWPWARDRVLPPGAGSFGASDQDVELGDLVVYPASVVAGVVKDRAGRPLKGVEVRAGSGGVAFFSPSSRASTTTDADGHFEIAELMPGVKTLRTSSSGHLPHLSEVSLAAGQQRRDLELVLDEGRSISGQVLDDLGLPIAGARVGAQRREGRMGMEVVAMRRGEASTTDANGFFVLGGLEGETASLSAWSDGHASQRQSGVAIGAQNVVFSLPRHAVVEGVLLSDAGEPLADSRVWTESRDRTSGRLGRPGSFEGLVIPQGRSRATTAADGSFRVEGVEPGAVVVVAEGEHRRTTSAPLELRAAETVSGVRLTAKIGGVLEATVRDPSGELLAGAKVVVQRPKPGPAQGRVRMESRVEDNGDGPVLMDDGNSLGSGTTDAEGKVRIAGLPAGFAEVVAEHEAHAPSAVAALQAPEAGVVRLDLSVREGGRLEVTTLMQDGEPAAAARFELAGPDGETRRHETDAGGRFAIAGLVPGVYRITLTLPPLPVDMGGGGVMVFSSGDRPLAQTRQTLEVVAGSTTAVELRRPVLAQVSGRVESAEGPAANVVVTLEPQSEEDEEGGIPGLSSGPTTTTGADGTFALEDIPAGRYVLRWGRRDQVVKDREELEIAPGVPSIVRNLRMRGGVLEVMVVDADGDPLADAKVYVERGGAEAAPRRQRGMVMISVVDDGNGPEQEAMTMTVGDNSVKTDGDGVARIPDVPPGVYTLRVTSSRYSDHRSAEQVVVDGQVTHAGTVELRRAARVAGKVTGLTGGVPMALVEYRKKAAPADAWQTEIAQGGAFRLNTLEPGAYVFRATPLGPPRAEPASPIEVDVVLEQGENPALELPIK